MWAMRSRMAAAGMTAAGAVRGWAGEHRKVVTGAGTLVTLGGLGVVLAGRWGRLADAAIGASGWLLGAAVVLHIGSLVARSEAWNLSVRAAGGTVGRRRLYRAASVGYIGNIINGELGFALRIASLRRSAPAEVPRISTLAATEVPLVIVEVTLATLTSFTLVGPLGLVWWAPVAAFVAILAVTVALRGLVRRRTAGWRKGLSVLGDSAACTRMAAFVGLAVCGQVVRNWLMLQATGIHASIFDATAVLIAVAVLGVLPVGPSVGAAAAVLLLGAQGVAGVSAAGVLLTATGTAGALAYAAWAYADRRWRQPGPTPVSDGRGPVIADGPVRASGRAATSSSGYAADPSRRARGPVAVPRESEAHPDLADGKTRSGSPPAGRGPGFLRRHRRAVTAVVSVAAIAGFIQFVVPQLNALGPTLHTLRGADPRWLGLGVAVEAVSIAGYVTLFRTVFSCHGTRIGWRASYQITMAGIVATKLFAAAGAGGVALTVWALRAAGLGPRTVARRVLAFEFFLYGVYAGAIVVVGLGLGSGLFAGGGPWTLTVAPAFLGATAIVVLLSMRALPDDFERRMKPLGGAARGRRLRARLASAPWAVHDALGIAFSLIRERKPGLIGAIAYWAFDIATLWACFHAFGNPPPVAVIVMAYFVGALANALPLPGGLGGVEGGMIGAFLAFGTPASLAVLAVLSYRLISFWLPTVPGAAAYLQLRRTVGHWRDETPSASRVPPNAEPAGGEGPARRFAGRL
jgi:uncharacterized membrane protein YbhN (UPF0104 family)